MPSSLEESVEAAELAVFARRKLALDAAADAGLPGRFESFGIGGLRASMATADEYDFLNVIEGVTDQSAEALPDVIERFPSPSRITIVATSPSQKLIEWLRGVGYERAPVRPIAFLRLGPDFNPAGISAEPWRIHEVFTQEEMTLFVEFLAGGYVAPSEVGALIRTEHALLAYRLSLAEHLGVSLAMATAAPGSPSIRNLKKLGFTIVERTAWRFSIG